MFIRCFPQERYQKFVVVCAPGACFRLLIVEPGGIRRMARTALISKNVYLQMLGQTQFLNIAQIQRQRDD